MTVMRCPHCGGEIGFDPAGQDVRCEYCGSVITTDDYNDYLESKGLYQANELVCRQCGAKIISTDSTVATFCSYCGSSLVLDSHIAEEKRPDYIIPFKVKRNAAIKKYKERISQTLLAPDWMSDDENIEKFRGIYMPFHLLRYSGKGTYKGKASNTRIETQNGVKYDVTRTYEIEAPAEIDYDFIPVDASASFPDSMSRALSPYRAKDMVDFQLPYLAGYYADGTDVPVEIYGSKYGAIARNDIKNRGSVKTERVSVMSSDVLNEIEVEESSKTALFPAWFLSFRNGDKVSYAAVNGETGELAADIPIDFRKYLAASLILAGVVSLILNLLFTITPIRFMTLASVLSVIVFFTADRLLNDTYRQKKHLDDPGYRGEDADRIEVRGAGRKALSVTGTILTGLIAFLMGIILALFFDSQSVVLIGIMPVVLVIYVIVKCIVDVSTDIKIRRKRAPFYFKLFTLIKPVAAVLACAAAAMYDRNSDMLCYMAGIVSILMTVWTAFDVVRAQNKLTMRDLPLFTTERGGDA